jgi:micrococcal nuclease
MSRLLAILLICAMPVTALADKTYGSVTIAEVTSIYDGDTFRANIPDYPPIIGQHMGIRINGVDTPEMRGKCEQEKVLARMAKQYTVTALRNAKTIELRNMQRGKYFRIVADVYADGQSLGEGLVREGLAVVYDGGKKGKDWCK